MKISYSYRGVITVLNNDFCESTPDVKGNINFRTSYQPKRKEFHVVIEPHELLITAQKCLKQLNRIAATDYYVARRH